MADFKIAYNKTSEFEGGYSNDKTDRGGETWRGIARNFFPRWAGWQIVDEIKKQPNFKIMLSENKTLEEMVMDFYKKEFWSKMRGDEIYSQDFANEIYDSCVNMGVATGIKLTQQALNIPVTGKMDMLTLNTINNQ